MSSSKCARCEQTVYPVEGLRCLDKIWHKGCFKCHECSMTLNLKNYKGFEKRPYCNAHCPQAKATTVADTPEIRRLAENTRIQSQAKYHEDFEKSKGKGFTAIADDPETLRIKNTSKIISNVAYHGELERKKQMEERRGLSGSEDALAVNNNSNKHRNRMQNNLPQNQQPADYQVNNYPTQGQYQQIQQMQQQQIHQQQQQLQKQKQLQQQQLLKQQQMHYAQDQNGQPVVNRQSQLLEQQQTKYVQQSYPLGHPQHQQAQMMRQQQMMMQRQAMDPNSPINRQQSNSNNIPQQMIKHQVVPNQIQHPMNQQPPQLIGSHHMMNPIQMGGIPGGQRMVPGGPLLAGSQSSHHPMIQGYNHQIGPVNGATPKQQQFVGLQPRHIIHPSQMQQINSHQVRPQQMIPQQQVPRRVFRAMYDYVANDVDEVSFFENDLLVDCMNIDANWLVGKVARSGQTGMLPANYVTEFTS